MLVTARIEWNIIFSSISSSPESSESVSQSIIVGVGGLGIVAFYYYRRGKSGLGVVRDLSVYTHYTHYFSV
jgi:hypothetical protein